MLVNSAGEPKKDHEALLEYKEKYLILTGCPWTFFRLGRGPEYPVLSANRMLNKMLGYDAEDSLMEFLQGKLLPIRSIGNRLKMIW
jgi:hypothetical protein